MPNEGEFTPHLGRLRRDRIALVPSYRSLVLLASNRHGRWQALQPSNRAPFVGKLIGRGSAVARVLACRSRRAEAGGRPVYVRVGIARRSRAGIAGWRSHLRYLHRDGTAREGDASRLYARDTDSAEGAPFAKRCEYDRHQFRITVQAHDGSEYEDLKSITRRFMARMEVDLRTQLDWVAADHYDTGQPHTHIVLRGKDDRGNNLVIAPEYMTRGMRERAIEIVSLDLGPRSDLEIQDELRFEVRQERLTSIDRELLAEADTDRVVRPATNDPFRHAILTERLQRLKKLGIAETLGNGRWRLGEDLEPTLALIEERARKSHILHDVLAGHRLERPSCDQSIYEPAAMPHALVGRVLSHGISDEVTNRRFLIIDATDGRAYYVDLGKARSPGDLLAVGAIVRIDPRTRSADPRDDAIAGVAAANAGRYDIDLHLRHDPNATRAVAEHHMRRLAAIGRVMPSLNQDQEGRWTITPDYPQLASDYDALRAIDKPVSVTRLSLQSPDKDVAGEGVTWLDRNLLNPPAIAFRDAGFGRQAREAERRRLQWLIAQELAVESGGTVLFRRDMIARLEQREFVQAAAHISAELGVPFSDLPPGLAPDGVYRRTVQLSTAKFALLERSHDFLLIPWRPAFDQQMGRSSEERQHGQGSDGIAARRRSGPSL